jgi:HD-like signal output (HDOD) protein
MLSAHWKLPSPIVAAIKGHHCLDGGETDMAKAVHLADFVAHEFLSDQPDGEDPGSLERALRTLDQFGIDRGKFIQRCEQRLEDAGYTLTPGPAIALLST